MDAQYLEMFMVGGMEREVPVVGGMEREVPEICFTCPCLRAQVKNMR